ncbi:MAG: Gldg family protein [Chthoniobacterales bacterium]
MTMADEATRVAPKKIRRFQIGLNVLLQVGLILLLAAMVNYFGFAHYRRWDLSRDKKYALSDKTQRFLKSVKGKLRITVFFSPNNPINQDVQSLLTEYQYAARGKIDLENIDPERSLSRAKEVFDKYKVVTNEDLLIVDYQGRNKTVKASEMAEVDQGNQMFGEGPKIAAFKGEQAITGTMIDLVEGKKNVLGYVLGHKEPPLSENSPVSVLKTFIENDNVQFRELNLFEVDAIPPEVKAILIDGPQYDFSEREMKMLRGFWEKQGRILLLLDPTARTPRLTAFLNEMGLHLNDDRLMAMVRTGIEEVGLVRDVQARFLPENPVTARLADVRALFPGGASTITLEADRVRAANIRLQPLAQAEKGYWAEKDYNSGDQAKWQADAAANQGAVHTIAASIEKGASGDDRVQVSSARMVVVSTATFVQDNALKAGQQALDFVSGSVNWLLSREQLIGIAPKVPKTLTFSLDDNSLRNLRWLILVILPLIPAMIGFTVWWQRRA